MALNLCLLENGTPAQCLSVHKLARVCVASMNVIQTWLNNTKECSNDAAGSAYKPRRTMAVGQDASGLAEEADELVHVAAVSYVATAKVANASGAVRPNACVHKQNDMTKRICISDYS